jgi:hypothetical protein
LLRLLLLHDLLLRLLLLLDLSGGIDRGEQDVIALALTKT